MPDKHPYASPGAITAAVNQFRKSFPPKIAADTLRKLSIAPNNESYVINTLRFIGAIDEEGNKTEESTTAFNQHDLTAFQSSFGGMVKKAYAELFKLHSDGAWELDTDSLISFFRTNDRTSDAVGRKQASTFQALAGLAGHGEAPSPQKQSPKPREAKHKDANTGVREPHGKAESNQSSTGAGQQREMGLTVRIEVNLPAATDQETYDMIFRSIRENLLDAK
jgi:hypothetical protein